MESFSRNHECGSFLLREADVLSCKALEISRLWFCWSCKTESTKSKSVMSKTVYLLVMMWGSGFWHISVTMSSISILFVLELFGQFWDRLRLGFVQLIKTFDILLSSFSLSYFLFRNSDPDGHLGSIINL